MRSALDLLLRHELASSLLGLALLVLFLVLALRRRLRELRAPLLVIAALLALPALGGLLVSPGVAWWLGVVSGCLLVLMIASLLLTGVWSTLLFLTLLGALLLAGGGLWLDAAQRGLLDLGRTLASLELVHPLWLVLLLLIPAFVVLASRSLYFPDLTPRDRRLFWRGVFPTLVLLFPVGLLLLGWYAVRCWPRLRVETWRPWVALGLRSLLVIFITLALAEPRLRQTNENVTVLFVVDRSQSVPEDLVEDPAQPGVLRDRRRDRLIRFLDEAVRERGHGHERDRAGLIVFGRRPRLELSPSDAPRVNLSELPAPVDGQRTDIAAAVRLALASFPQDTGRRIVLCSDGNENLGDLEEVAREARTLGVQIDVVPLAAGQRNDSEVLLERVEVPPRTEQGSKVPIRVLVRSHNPNVVVARLTVKQITEKERDVTVPMPAGGDLGLRVEPAAGGQGVRVAAVADASPLRQLGVEPGNEIIKIDNTAITGPIPFAARLGRKRPGEPVTLLIRRDPVKLIVDTRVELRPGLNPFSFSRPLTDEQRSYTYEAEVQPLRIEDGAGNVLHRGRLPGDRVQNNRASAHVIARGQRRVLLLENRPADRPGEVIHAELADRLRGAGDRKFHVDVRPVTVLSNYPDPAKLAVFLGDYDCVLLANVPAEAISEGQREALRSNTHDQGAGLVAVGGRDSFGAGGWQNTALEKALPVDADVRSLKVEAKSGLVLIMHACEMADGNFWQKKVGKLAVERLGPVDEVGVIDFNFAPQWSVPMQEVGPNRARILALIDRMMPGDMIDFDPCFQMAYTALTAPERNIATRHIILISDGDPQYNPATLQKLRAAKITVTTVGIATHGPNEDQKMAVIARNTGGRPYSVKDPSQLPAIYIRESRLVSQSFIHEKRFEPQVLFRSGPTEKLPDPVPPLRGYVRTTPKPSPLVVVPMVTPKFNEQEFPLLAYWHYGLGKSVAFTSDAGDPTFWSREWVEGGMYARFWEQVVEWSLRPTESHRLTMVPEYRDGRIRIAVEARDEEGRLDASLRVRGGITVPGASPEAAGKRRLLTFVQKSTGLYEAEVRAEESGSYFITAQATRTARVKGPDGKTREVEEGVDSVRGGLTLPYSPEYADLESNSPLLERVAGITSGKVYADDDAALEEAARSGVLFRPGLPRLRSQQPLWYWLVFLTGLILFLDIAVRRVALGSEEARAALRTLWARVRGLPVTDRPRETTLDRLQGRRARTQEEMARATAARRFEPAPGGLAPPTAGAAPPLPRPPAPRAATDAPATPAQAGQPPAGEDALERLARAKRKVWEDRGKEDREDRDNKDS